MVAPLEHRDTEPLESVIVDLQDQIERERYFLESVLWKIRLLEREIQYCQRQIASFSRILEVPREILTIGRENRKLDDSLVTQRERLKRALKGVEEDELQKMGQRLLDDLEREINRDLANEGQETISRILEAYVETGLRYMERCQSLVASLTRRLENLGKERAISRHEESKLERMYELSVQFHKDHEDASYGDFKVYVMHLLGIEMERELTEAIHRLPH